ncbi:hypothetical protein MKEN_00994500 [Mycena kentingensis (nom. inval.)]|nr:hypothetical protein MKEN_00994500 [Mycena kentingensis (nom. inval.)]
MLFSGFGKFLLNLRVFLWDAWLTILNWLSPKRKVGAVVAKGLPGHGRRWPEYMVPGAEDSRCSCPALNTMANHGILPRDGKNIKFTDIAQRVHETFNFAITFSTFVTMQGADTLKKDYNTGTCNLSDLDLHNGIEHDASLFRQDAKFQPDQGKPYIPFVNELLELASGKDTDGTRVLTIEDLSKFSSMRRADSRARNPEFQLDKQHQIFGSANSSTLLAIFGGRVNDLETFLKEERLPDGWESRNRTKKGLTFIAFNPTTIAVEHGIDETAYVVSEKDKEEDEMEKNESGLKD